MPGELPLFFGSLARWTLAKGARMNQSTSERIPLHCGVTDLHDQTLGASRCRRDKVMAFRIGNTIEIKDKRHGETHVAVIQFTDHSSGLGLGMRW